MARILFQRCHGACLDRNQLEQTEGRLVAEKEAHAATARLLSAEETHVVQLREQINGLEQRLAEQVEYRQSLEQKHENARQALEHFRAATKEQREQEQRRHEQQVQQLQADIRGLNGSISEKLAHVAQLSRDAAALSAENGNLRTQVQQLRSDFEQSQREILRTREAAQHSEGQRQALEKQVQELKLTHVEHRDRAAADSQRIRELELAAAREDVQREQAQEKINVLQTELDWITNLASVAGISGSAKKLQGLSPESVERLARLRAEARRVMEREGAAELWLHQRNAALRSVSPAELVDSDAGLEEAVQLLTRIEHGVPT